MTRGWYHVQLCRGGDVLGGPCFRGQRSTCDEWRPRQSPLGQTFASFAIAVAAIKPALGLAIVLTFRVSWIIRSNESTYLRN